MSSAATIKLDCRQTRDAINALSDFLIERRDVHGALASLLRDDLDRARQRVGEIERALERRPQIGLLMPSGAAADGLISTFGGARDGNLLGVFAGGGARLPVLTGLVAPGTPHGLAARVRLTNDDQVRTSGRTADTVSRMMDPAAEPTRRSSDVAVRVEVLTLADVIAILARAYCSHVKAYGAAPQVADIVAAIDQTELADVTQASQTGLSAHHVRAVRTYLDQRFRDHPRLGVLAAAGYWDAFAALAPRATAEGRKRLASLLWGNLGDFDVVYSELAAVLDRLNHTNDILCPPDAVRALPATGAGWGEAHPYSILSAATLLSDTDAAGEVIDVRSRFGQSIGVSRNILAVLTREVTLSIDGDPTALLAGADLVQFPVACPDVIPREASGPLPSLASSDGIGSAPWFARALLQSKTLYLAETAVSRMDLSGLVIHLDATHALPASFAPVLADWIEKTHGHTPHAREQTDTTLFVAVDAPAAASPLVPLETFLGPSHLTAWLDRWGTNSAFDNLFILMAGRRASDLIAVDSNSRLGTGRARATGTAIATRDLHADTDSVSRWLKHVRDAAAAVDEALHAGDGGIAYLAQSVAALDYGRARRQQLGATLNAMRSDLANTIDRLLYASAPDAENDWRHHAALAAQAHLRTATADQKLGHLIAALSPSERECAWLFERLANGTAAMDDGLQRRLANIDQLDGAADRKLALRYADQVMTHWVATMRLATQEVLSPRLYGMTAGTLTPLVEELAVAAVRCAVGERIAAGVARCLDGADLSRANVALTASAVARVASDVIGGFVSQLGFDTPWSSRHPKRRGTLGAPLFERASAVGPEDLATMQASRITLQFHADWIEGFGLMTEENVTQSRGTRFEDSEFRELAELRSLLGSNSRDRAL